MAACIFVACLGTISATGEDRSDLERLISATEDTRMDSMDLAFFLATHGYDAAPKDGYVEIKLKDKTCKLIPNGDRPGLCDIHSCVLEDIRQKI